MKGSPEKKPRVATVSKHQISSEEAQRLQTATQDIKQSLNITVSQSSSLEASNSAADNQPTISNVQQLNDPPQQMRDTSVNAGLITQVQKSSQDIKQTRETIERLGGIINALAVSSGDLPEHGETVAVADSNKPNPGAVEHVGDAFVHVALAGAMIEQPTENNTYSEAVQPEDTAKSSISEVTIAGEIVGSIPNRELTMADTSIAQASESTTTPSKKPKRQIAASFMNS